MTLVSYKGDKKLKDMLVKEIECHRKLDAIVQGTYGSESDKEFKGCAVGCSIHSLNVKLGKSYNTSDHSVYEKELGIPEWLARLEDTIFEKLPVDEAFITSLLEKKAVEVEGLKLEKFFKADLIVEVLDILRK